MSASRHRDWRANAKACFDCEKAPATGRDGMVVTNHPLASTAGTEMLAAGGNAVDAAIAALFTLTVVEPMMVGIFGGGVAHICMKDGAHVVLDGLSAAPAAAAPGIYRPVSDEPARYMQVENRENELGARAIATPGSLRGWCDALERFGTLPLADVMEPAIRHARRGFAVTPYLAACIDEAAEDLSRDPEMKRLLLPGGAPLKEGARLVMADYAATLQQIAENGPDHFYSGPLGQTITEHLARAGGMITMQDLAAVRTVERSPIEGTYRGHRIFGPPPPSAGGVHVVQMLNILEGYDIAAMGFGSDDAMHVLGEALKIAFADRAAATADPAFVNVPVERLTSKDYAEQRRAEIDMASTRAWAAGVKATESANTTHVSVTDKDGNIVSSTQTINGLFGARIMIPGTGIIPNNYMCLFDPHPGNTLSVAPGKRVTTSMAPTIVLRGGAPLFVLGLPGGLRIFGSAMQALVNLIDHGMTLQEAVEAPRLWTQGQELEIEEGYGNFDALRARGWTVLPVPHVGGGMTAIEFGDAVTGAACWRADGIAAGLGGGHARSGTKFWPDAPKPAAENAGE
ncbi:gamma-glutamyltransferase [Pelagivirga sediminicola]|uniref:Glutathione hydrolase proenzyme n=1 Tax=Pelagivirga sediminicola TaxID=2170575 RepID=A0A2T7G962_9RHOB|nr:gamma-glutamyltransferase [Pelagivirga sediminicola]PVA10962.1 gamma-glutamyltransferase [Pelagivirga sediminicola]